MTDTPKIVINAGNSGNQITINAGGVGKQIVNLAGPPGPRGQTAYQDLMAFAYGALDTSEVLLRVVFASPITISVDGSYCISKGAATNAVTISLLKNDVSCGTITFSAGATTGVIAFTDAEFDRGDIFEVDAPYTPDKTLSNVSITFKGKSE